MTKKKICVITGSRAEFGLLKNTIQKLKNNKKFHCKLLVLGSHFSDKFGKTIQEIHKSKIKIDKKINTEIEKKLIHRISAETLKNVYEYLKQNSFNLIIILGDRFEIFSSAIAAMYLNIPIAHIHGGELTYGLIDDAIRHSLTKMSHVHFVSNNVYKKRIIQLGENPKKIFNVGAPGVENIRLNKYFSKSILEKKLNIKFGNYNCLVSYHPETLNIKNLKKNFDIVLSCLKKYENITKIFTFPNFDEGHDIIIKKIKKFINKNNNCYLIKSLGNEIFLNCLNQVDFIIGNSSSGILEMPYFNKPTINVGIRQNGRIFSKSVICAHHNFSDICKAINKSYNKKFLKKISKEKKKFGDGNTSYKICSILSNMSFENLILKKFNDI